MRADAEGTETQGEGECGYRAADLAAGAARSEIRNSIMAWGSSAPPFRRLSAACRDCRPWRRRGLGILRGDCRAIAACLGRMPGARAACKPVGEAFNSAATCRLRDSQVECQ